ncbi:MAG: helix-turn-helix domain-containing protein [Ekhidna sp.]|uniref:TetR/AcrR family transcriptional regulator n=1 Tax=Ekhidna sp. TaxID=2608089 RepID=UPI0032F05027
MTEKQEKIITAALELFAEEGYRSTSTSKVAKRAGVSEGLIFRHFTNKDGLLDAIIKMGEEQAKALFADIVLEPDPKELIRKYIELFITVSKDQEAINFWKLQFKIKWELEIYGEHKMEAIKGALINAFEKLRYNHPEQEANLLLTLMDGLATRFILQQQFDMSETIEFLKQKYKV